MAIYYSSYGLKAYETQEKMVHLAQSHRESKSVAKVKVFLSHSHHDKDHVQAARQFLEAHGASIYVDWEDGEMPITTDADTAKLLKKRIIECSCFVLLASERIKASLWVPWELGFADAAKSVDRIAILPFLANSGGWDGTEYVKLYPTIRPGEQGAGVFLAGQTTGKLLSRWLTP